MKPVIRRAGLLAALATLSFAGIASAHITLDSNKAAAGSTYKAIFRVPHGCDGSPTTAIRVRIPDGVVNVKPMAHAGWRLSTKRAKLAQPYTLEGKTITDGVVEVAWTGGKLPDDHYDEFVLRGALPDRPGETIYFPVVQECASGTTRWVEIPTQGKTVKDYTHPAPGVALTGKTTSQN